MTIRWGLIGVGDIANKRVASAIIDDANSELVAVCRRDPGKLNAFADRFDVAKRFVRAEDLLTTDGIDAVYIATPVDCHCSQTIAAAKTGKHVLVEKPMALSGEECRSMVKACQSAGVHLGVAFYRRFYPVVGRIKQLIEGGEIGRVLSIGCVTGNPNRFSADDWRVRLESGGGGPLADIGSHRIDVMLQLLGTVKRVKASVCASPDFEAEQSASLILQFASGAHGVLQCYFGTVDAPDRLEVIGVDGRILVEDLNAGDLILRTSQGEKQERHPPAENLHSPLIADFVSSIAEKRPPMITGEIGSMTNEIMQQAYLDARD